MVIELLDQLVPRTKQNCRLEQEINHESLFPLFRPSRLFLLPLAPGDELKLRPECNFCPNPVHSHTRFPWILDNGSRRLRGSYCIIYVNVSFPSTASTSPTAAILLNALNIIILLCGSEIQSSRKFEKFRERERKGGERAVNSRRCFRARPYLRSFSKLINSNKYVNMCVRRTPLTIQWKFN